MPDDFPDTETYEHIPWSQLTLTNSGAERGRWMYLVASLLVVAAIAAVVARMVWQPETAVTVPSASPVPTVSITSTPETVPAAALYSEADLMAVSPPSDVALGVRATAERFLRNWATDSDESWTYVEWTTVDSVADLGDGLFQVSLLMQLLHGGEEGAVRLPVEGVVVTIQVDGDEMSVVDLPAPTGVKPVNVLDPLVGALYPVVESGEIPDAVATAALERAASWGVGTISGGRRVGDLWRVEVSVESVLGPVRSVAVWLAADGSPRHPMP